MDDKEPKVDDVNALIENRKSGKKDVLESIGSIETIEITDVEKIDPMSSIGDVAKKWRQGKMKDEKTDETEGDSNRQEVGHV